MVPTPWRRYFPAAMRGIAPGQVLEWLKRNAWNAFRRFTPSRGFESLPVRCRSRSAVAGSSATAPASRGEHYLPIDALRSPLRLDRCPPADRLPGDGRAGAAVDAYVRSQWRTAWARRGDAARHSIRGCARDAGRCRQRTLYLRRQLSRAGAGWYAPGPRGAERRDRTPITGRTRITDNGEQRRHFTARPPPSDQRTSDRLNCPGPPWSLSCLRRHDASGFQFTDHHGLAQRGRSRSVTSCSIVSPLP